MKKLIALMVIVFVLTGFGLSYAGEDNMVLVPAGEFIFGPPGSEKTVYLKSYFIDKYEVTVGQFKEFVKATGYVTTAEKSGYTFDSRAKYHGYTWKDTKYKVYSDNYPVTCVSPADAEAYAKWAGKRLPTSEEWEKAARGTDGRKYPWGNKIPAFKKMGNYGEHLGEKGPVKVGSYPDGASPYGCLDMIGNLWEFARIGEYGYCQRGGSWNQGTDEELTTYCPRGRFGPNFTSKHCTTFRCVKDAE
jgi:formylglycine-generating enzyme required for sulfatase activity